jgi:hypothetical protein
MSIVSRQKTDQTVSFLKKVLPSRPQEYIKFPENIKTFPEKIIYIGELETTGKLCKWESFYNMQVLCAQEVKKD